MRERKEIENNGTVTDILMLEVLLDIRELLMPKIIPLEGKKIIPIPIKLYTGKPRGRPNKKRGV